MTDIPYLLDRFVRFCDRAGGRVMMMRQARRVRRDEVRVILEEMEGLRAELNELLDSHERT